MTILDLALRNIAHSSFRSTVVVICALLVAGFALSTTLVVRGAEESLRLSKQRLGADIVVVPQGTEAEVEGALLTGQPISVWMPANVAQKVAAVEGVDVVSPQLFLASMKDATCCTASEMFIVAIDPATDFTIQPWLRERLGRGLGPSQSIGGDLVFVPDGEPDIKLYGFHVTLDGNLEPTGTGIDQTLFITYDTAYAIAKASRTGSSMGELKIPANSISAAMVRVKPDYNPRFVAADIVRDVPNVRPIASPDLFYSVGKQMESLLRAVTAVLGIALSMSVLFIALIFSIAVNERKREIGVLRALGSTRLRIFASILIEAGVLAAAGGMIGIALFGAATYLFHNLLVSSLGIPFLLPTIPGFLMMVLLGLGLALLSVALAAMVPAVRVSLQEPAMAMRE